MFPCDFRSQYFFHILGNAIVLYEWGQYWGFPVDGPYYDSCDSLTYLTTLVPPQVERWYLDAGPSAFSLSASSVLIIEALLWSSTTAYTRWTSLGRSRHPPALSWCKVVHPGDLCLSMCILNWQLLNHRWPAPFLCSSASFLQCLEELRVSCGATDTAFHFFSALAGDVVWREKAEA